MIEVVQPTIRLIRVDNNKIQDQEPDTVKYQSKIKNFDEFKDAFTRKIYKEPNTQLLPTPTIDHIGKYTYKIISFMI